MCDKFLKNTFRDTNSRFDFYLFFIFSRIKVCRLSFETALGRVSWQGFMKFIQMTKHPVSRFSEYAENIGDGKSEEFKESEQKRIMELLENF